MKYLKAFPLHMW